MRSLARRLGGAAALLALVAGCATAPKPAVSEGADHWSGRLALQVQDRPIDSFSATFELSGSPEAGELSLSSPLAGTLGILAWRPGSATLTLGSKVRQYASVEDLVSQVTGSSIPVAALFDWLNGTPRDVPGWQADLSQVGQGRLSARRTQPVPEADLRVVFER